MKKNLYLYLFIFASLIALIFYVNGRKYQTQLEQKIVELKKEADKQEEKLETVQAQIAIADFITIKGNPEAENYFLKYNLTSSQVEALLYDKLLELNIKDGGNPLIPYIGANRGFAIDQIQTLNHKWIAANFTDGDQWGDVLLKYDIDQDQEVTFETIETVLYTKNRG
ncbi:hypothetical protein [Nonlabens sp. SY33080]|uniref:hypothetical protein n=1 Tax=Nonlabens sp. SY33080 TaxID=2719911 RepID=UPI0014289D6F|nr:hypothetical protein [Nonlabens sp. SY33080]